jgi:hypothetical protein
MLGEPNGIQSALFGGTGELIRLNRMFGRENMNTKLHVASTLGFEQINV